MGMEFLPGCTQFPPQPLNPAQTRRLRGLAGTGAATPPAAALADTSGRAGGASLLPRAPTTEHSSIAERR